MRWISNRMSAAYRHKRLRLAATIRARIQVLGVATALWVLFSAMGQDSLRTTARVGYVLIAAGYLWLEIHYGAKALGRRFERAERSRALRKLKR